jgi:hypothetical protein
MPVGTTSSGSRLATGRLYCQPPSRRSACEAGGLPVAYAAQGVHSRWCCGKIVFEFPIRDIINGLVRYCHTPLAKPLDVWLARCEQ